MYMLQLHYFQKDILCVWCASQNLMYRSLVLNVVTLALIRLLNNQILWKRLCSLGILPVEELMVVSWEPITSWKRIVTVRIWHFLPCHGYCSHSHKTLPWNCLLWCNVVRTHKSTGTLILFGLSASKTVNQINLLAMKLSSQRHVFIITENG